MEELNKNRLFIDASMKSLTVVISSRGQTFEGFDDQPKETLEQMFPLIMSLCEKAGIKYRDLDEIYATTGPGSTTGIRMALTQARVFFALKHEADLYGAPTLEVLFRASKLKNGLAILSDRHNTLFYALYKDGQKISDGHADKLEDINGFSNETIIYASIDEGAKVIAQGHESISLSLAESLQVREAYKKYTPDDVQDLVPLYTEKI